MKNKKLLIAFLTLPFSFALAIEENIKVVPNHQSNPTHLFAVNCSNVDSGELNIFTNTLTKRNIDLKMETKVWLRPDGTIEKPYIDRDQFIIVTSAERELLNLTSDSMVHDAGKMVPVSESKSESHVIPKGLFNISHVLDVFGNKPVYHVFVGNYFIVPNSNSKNGLAQLSGVVHLVIDLKTGITSGRVNSLLTTFSDFIGPNGTVKLDGKNEHIASDSFTDQKCEVGITML